MKIQALAKKIKILHGMSHEQISEIVPRLNKQTFAQGDWVVEEDAPANGMYIIFHGSVQVWKTSHNKKQGFCLGELTVGDCFGEMALIDCQNRSASVIAASDLTVYHFPYEAMAHLYEQNPKLYGLLLLNISREISRRLRTTDRTLVEFALPLPS